MVYPVVHALRESEPYRNGQLGIEVLGLPAARDTLSRNGVDCIGFADYLDKDADADAIAWGKDLAREHHSPTIGVSLEDSVAYLGLCYKDLVMRLGEQEAAKQFQAKARHAFYPLTILERIFDDIRPDFVVTSNSPRSEAAAIEVANQRGIDNLIMTDLFTGISGYRFQARNITFLNEFAKDMFVADGLADPSVSAFYYTGNPAFDTILNLPKGRDAQWLPRHFPDIKGKPVVLHADMPAYLDCRRKCVHTKTDAEIIEEMQACYNAAMANNAAYLIRPHPSQDRRIYIDWLAGRRDAYLAAEPPLHELLVHIDLLVARTTTVGLEAAYLHKRIVQLDADYHADLPLAKMGIAWGVNGYGKLPGAIKNALTDDKTLEQIKNTIKRMLPGEPAAGKVAGIILDRLYGRQSKAANA